MEILRYAAFSADPDGGNPAGVVLDATGMSDDEMLAVAANVGYSETAFLFPRSESPGNARDDVIDVRYFSPLAEVPFCGHATIGSAVAHAERHGPGALRYGTRAGLVEVVTAVSHSGAVTATLTSVQPRTEPLAPAELTALLTALRWTPQALDPAMPPRVAYAGAWHPILAVRTRERLAELHYDVAALGALMAEQDWTTVDLVWRESADVFHARNPFPPGGVVEDPATGAAAAAFGGYLREFGLVTPPITVTVLQGEDMGRPSCITVGIPAGQAGIDVTGTAVQMERLT